MGEILVWDTFFAESISVPNFMKIQESGYVFVDLVWNDPKDL